MSSPAEPTLLSSHTLDSLCDVLLSGGPVRLDDGSLFQLVTEASRAAFDWYNSNRSKWGGRVVQQDLEALAERVDRPLPSSSTARRTTTVQSARKLTLKSVRAHRFAGIHRFGLVNEPPEEFYCEFDKPFTLLEGDNGAGKTSVQNTILWCLTGYIYRPQRQPELANQAVPVQVGCEAGGVAEDSSHVMSPITPIPPDAVLRSLGDAALPLDTWVELVFVDEAGNDAGKIRRKVQRGPNNTVVVREPDFSALDLDPIAREIGTRMPGLIPHITLGAKSDLGKAVAELIGIKPLQDLARHASRSREKLADGLRKEREAEIVSLDAKYAQAAESLTAVLSENLSLAPEAPHPRAGEDGAKDALESLKRHFESRQAEMLSGARTLLGALFDYNDQAARQSLVDHVGPALGAFDATSLKNLPSAARLGRLATLPGEAIESAERIACDLLAEAEELARLARQPDVASRVRLYAKVVGWLKETPEQRGTLTDCPVCWSALEGKVDDVTKRAVTAHLQEHMEEGRAFLEKTPLAWAQHALSVLHGQLHQILCDEIRQDLPASPGDLIMRALSVELFQNRCFSGCLAALKPTAERLCRDACAALPEMVEPTVPFLPAGFAGPETGGIGQALRRMARALAAARWLQQQHLAWREAFQRVIGGSDADGLAASPARDTDAPHSLRSQVAALDRLVKSAAPVRESLVHVRTMSEVVTARQALSARLERYARAAQALDGLSGLARLVENQVNSLMRTLSAETAKWRRSLYAAAFTGAPEVTATTVEGDGSLTFAASAHGATVPAHHVSNASDLRATLLAFLLAFWQYLYRQRGGLSLFLLDEPQELFDRSNQRRVARTLPSLVGAGAKVILTTSSLEFARRVTATASQQLGTASLDHRRVHPLRGDRPHIELSQCVEAIEEKRLAFEAHENDPQPARDYLKDLRIYLEIRLLDLFDSPGAGLPPKPTLANLIGAIRNRVNGGRDAFTSVSFQDLVGDSDLADGSAFLELMNESHHSGEHLISYTDVSDVKEACLRVRKLVEAAHEEFELWLRRDPREVAGAMPLAPAGLTFPVREVPVLDNLAAFSRVSAPGELERTEEKFSTAVLANHMVYIIHTHNFGFAAPRGSHAIVDLFDESVEDSRLVVAMYGGKVFARRLLRESANPGVVVLASEAENPLKRPPSLFLPTAEVRILKVVGILFEDPRPHRRTEDEAGPAGNCTTIETVEIAYRVRGDSALPLALPGQLVLGGKAILPSQLNEMEGHLVAISTSEGDAFKRIGKAVSGAGHVRQFDSIGGRGESMFLRTEEIDDEPLAGLALLYSARLILGVIYE